MFAMGITGKSKFAFNSPKIRMRHNYALLTNSRFKNLIIGNATKIKIKKAEIVYEMRYYFIPSPIIVVLKTSQSLHIILIDYCDIPNGIERLEVTYFYLQYCAGIHQIERQLTNLFFISQ